MVRVGLHINFLCGAVHCVSLADTFSVWSIVLSVDILAIQFPKSLPSSEHHPSIVLRDKIGSQMCAVGVSVGMCPLFFVRMCMCDVG